MSSKVFRVLKPGLLTTIQDLGRQGFQQYGMVVAGAMDSFSLQVGNLLVGNRRGEAALEITTVGPELEVLNDTVVSICGANLSPTLDGANIPLWRSFEVKKGQILRFGAPKEGIYAYLAVAGGFNVPLVIESKSTYMANIIKSLGSRENLATVAKNLFRLLREFDDEKVDIIIAEGIPLKDLGLAVMNRLRKAADFNVMKA